MSYEVTKVVRKARMPRTMKRRPVAKAVLLALADRCHDDGRDAWPSVATIAREVEISKRTVDKVLLDLKAAGLIFEQARPTQHRPRTWCLNRPLLEELADTHDLATLNAPDTHDLATLSATSDTHRLASLDSARHANLEARVAESEVRVATCCNRTDPLNGSLKRTPAPPAHQQADGHAASSAEQPTSVSRAPGGEVDFMVVVMHACHVMDETGLADPRDQNLIEAVEERCATEQIHYGRDATLRRDVVVGALIFAHLQRTK